MIANGLPAPAAVAALGVAGISTAAFPVDPEAGRAVRYSDPG